MQEQASGTVSISSDIISKEEDTDIQLKIRMQSMFYHALADQSMDAFMVHDDKGRFIEVNTQSCQSLGYSKDEILSMLVTDIEMDIELEALREKCKRINPGESFTSNGHHRRKDGSLFPVEVRFVCEQLDHHKLFLGFVRDLSDKQLAASQIQLTQKQLEESESKFRAVFETSNAGKSITMVDGEMFVNQAFSDMLGYSRQELQNKSWREITPPEDIVWLEEMMKPLNEGEIDSLRITKRYIRKDGSYVWTDLSSAIKRDDKGNPLFYSATVIDISERIKAEQELDFLNRQLEQKVRERTMQLETANKELEAFNYSVSHDLRAPLRKINGYASILHSMYVSVLDDQARQFLENIRKNVTRMDQLITDLLNLSQVSRIALNPEIVSMHELAQMTYHETATDEENEQFEFVLHDIPPVKCDLSLISQVWQNLINNALKYSSKSKIKKIEVYSTESKYMVTYHVRDYGVGFDNNQCDKIFKAFQRLHSGDDFSGNGIGLAVVQQIVHRHGGKVFAHSYPGKGAEFRFALPKMTCKNAE